MPFLNNNLNRPLVNRLYVFWRKTIAENHGYIGLTHKIKRVLYKIESHFKSSPSDRLQPVMPFFRRGAQVDIPEQPESVAIVIPMIVPDDKRLRHCLNGIQTNTVYPVYTVFIVGPTFTYAFRKYTRRLPVSIELISIQGLTERSATSALNRIIRGQLDFSTIIFLDPRTEVFYGWLTPLVESLNTEPGCAVVGPHIIDEQFASAASALHALDHEIVQDGIRFRVEHAHIYTVNRYRSRKRFLTAASLRATPALSGICQAWKKEAFLRLGALDPNMRMCDAAVDICLRAQSQGFSAMTCASSRLFVKLPTSKGRAYPKKGVAENPMDHQRPFNRRWGKKIGRLTLDEKLNGQRPFWAEHRLTIGMIVTETHPGTVYGDYFTARGLGNALEKLGYTVVYLAERPVYEWHLLSERLDILIVLRHTFDPAIAQRFPQLKTIAWVRGYVDKWCAMPWFHRYDGVIASSEMALAVVKKHTLPEKCLGTLMLAADTEIFKTGEIDPAYRSDICFVGNLFEIEREFTRCLKPDNLSFKLYGKLANRKHPLAKYHCGQLSHDQVPKLYRATKIVIEDCTPMCSTWGCLNSRTFEAMATGACVLSNDVPGLKQLFGDAVVVYRNEEDFNDKVHWLLNDESRRAEIGAMAKNEIDRTHTYRHRADQFRRLLFSAASDRRGGLFNQE